MGNPARSKIASSAKPRLTVCEPKNWPCSFFRPIHPVLLYLRRSGLSNQSQSHSQSAPRISDPRPSSIAWIGAHAADIITETMTARGYALRIALMAALLRSCARSRRGAPRLPRRGAIPSTKRERKEAFVSGNDGTTFTEVSAIVAIVPLGAAARRALDVARGIRMNAKGETITGSGAKVTSAAHGIVADFVFLVVPAVAATMSPEVGITRGRRILSLVLHVGFRSIAKRDDWSFPDGVSSTFGDSPSLTHLDVPRRVQSRDDARPPPSQSSRSTFTRFPAGWVRRGTTGSG